MKQKWVFMTGLISLLMATVAFAHLPSPSMRSVFWGRQTGPDGQPIVTDAFGRATRMTSGGFRPPAPWNAQTEYQGSHLLGEGDTVIYGTFNGVPLLWWARFAADSNSRPGQMAAEGGTPPWVLINSVSQGRENGQPFQAATWHGNNTSVPAIRNIQPGQAIVPTWRDGVSGVYAITLDDIGSMPFALSVQPAWDLTSLPHNRYMSTGSEHGFRGIVMAWGVHVGAMTAPDWQQAIRMVATGGHEMFNHSIDHTSASDNWHIFWPGTRVTQTDPAVPPSLRGLEVFGTWEVTAISARGTRIGNRGVPNAAPFNFGPSAGNFTITEAMRQGTTDGSSFGNPATHMINGSIWIDGEPDGGHPFTIEARSEMVTVTWPAYWTGYDPQTGIPWNDPRIRVVANQTMRDPVTGRTLTIEPVTLAGGQVVYVAYREFNPDAGEFVGYQDGFIAATGVQWFETGALIEQFPHFYNGARIQTDWTSTGCTQSGCATNGQPGWFVTTRDQGRPGFVAKLFTREGWDVTYVRRNIDTANYLINRNLFAHIETAGQHFARGRQSEFYGYPFDIYDENLHDYLFGLRSVPFVGGSIQLDQNITNRFVGARGGAKSGQPMAGDFFHPFRIDFDAFYINRHTWTPATSNRPEYLVPNNPHVLMGLDDMVNQIVATNGFMIRELHSVSVHTDLHPDVTPGSIPWYDLNQPSAEAWPINTQTWNGQPTGGWWGGITAAQMAAHFDHIRPMIEDFRLAVMNPSEVIKYRMTRNAFETQASLTADGQNWRVQLNGVSGANGPASVDTIHREEISVIVNLDYRVSRLAVAYDGNPLNTSATNSPRRRPVPMNWDGSTASIWSVSINPWSGPNHSALLIRNGEWFGQGEDYRVPDGGEFERPTAVGRTAQRRAASSVAQFAGIRSGQIVLNLSAGNYTAELFNVQGRMISSVNINALAGVNMTGLRTDHLARGMFILRVRNAQGAPVLQHRFMVR